MKSCIWGIRSRDGVMGRKCTHDKPCLEQMKFKVLARPLSGQKWELETGCGASEMEMRVEVRSRKCLKVEGIAVG